MSDKEKSAEFWKKEALALVVLLRAKCSDEEWAEMESRFECTAPASQPANYAIALDVVDAIEWIDQNEPKRARDVLAEVRDKLRATPQVTPTLHCYVTGNPCGTDTWAPDRPCACFNCQLFLRKTEASEQASPTPNK